MKWLERLQERFDAWRFRYPRGRPRVGQWIYIFGSYHLEHGDDDVAGGRCRVTKVAVANWGGTGCYIVEVDASPGTQYNWSTYLALQQRSLRARYGGERAGPDPDRRPEFNRN